MDKLSLLQFDWIYENKTTKKYPSLHATQFCTFTLSKGKDTMRKGILFFFALMIVVRPDVFAQEANDPGFEMVTIVKQSGEVTMVSFIAPNTLDGAEYEFVIDSISGDGVFSANGNKAGSSFTIPPLYRQLKGKTLTIAFRNMNLKVVIPNLYESGVIRVVDKESVWVHNASMSRMGVWNCRTTKEKNNLLPDHSSLNNNDFSGKGEVLLVPFDEDMIKSLSESVTYNGSFLPGEAIAEMTSVNNVSGEQPGQRTFLSLDAGAGAAMTPAIMQAAGINYIIQGNMNPGFYRWYAADLSYVFVWAPKLSELPSAKDKNNMIKAVFSELMRYDSLYQNEFPVYPIAFQGNSSDASQVGFIEQYWTSLKYRLNENGDLTPLHFPKISVVDASDALERLKNHIEMPVSIIGQHHEVNNTTVSVGFLENIKNSTNAVYSICAAEKFSVILSMLKGGAFLTYPEKALEEAWSALFQKQGGIAHQIADSILFSAFHEIALMISTGGNGKPFVVFNPGTHAVSDVITIDVKLPESKTPSSPGKMTPAAVSQWKVFDSQGNESPAQIISSQNEQIVAFSAIDIPGSGYKTYYLKAVGEEETNEKQSKIRSADNAVEIHNQFYDITLASNGISSLYDKNLRTELISNSQDAIGTYDLIRFPDTTRIYTVSEKNGLWKVVNDGPVFSELVKQDDTPAGIILSKLKIYHQVKKISIDVMLDKATDETGMIAVMPVYHLTGDCKVLYKTPFGFGDSGSDEMDDEVFMEKRDDRFPPWKNTLGEVTVVSEKAQISFSGNFSHCLISRNHSDGDNMVAPVFPVAEINESLLHLEISSSQKGDKQLAINAAATKNPLIAIAAPAKNIGLLTDQLSFFELRNRELEITRLKKSRNSNDVLMRIVNTEDKKTFAIMEPMFSFSGFSVSDINESFSEPVNTASAVRLKLKTPVLPWSVNTIILHHK